jgi:hypothetical protein
MPPLPPPHTFQTPLRVALRALACAGLLLLAAPAQAEKPLPFPADWEHTVEQTFFEAGDLSSEKLAGYRAGLEQRQRELLSVLIADYRDRGKKSKGIRRRLQRKKEAVVYRLLLGDSESLGMLGRLGDETDPVRARRLASQILEIDYALLIEGERPFSLDLIDYLSWAWFWQWTVDARSHADQAELEASNLWNPETGLYYEPDDLRALLEKGGDLSELDPPPDSSFWQQGTPIAQRDVRAMFYEGGAALHANKLAEFPERRARLDKIRLTQTKPKFELEVEKDGSTRAFKLKVGAEIHSEPTVNALLTTLGFNADLTHYVRDFRLDLDDDQSVEDLRNDWRSYFENRRTHNRFAFDDYFVEGEDDEGRYLQVREGVLELKPPEILRIGPWPFGGNGNRGNREVRALGLFSVWVGNTDLKEAENNKLAMRQDEPPGDRFYHMHHDLGHSLGRMINEQLDAFPWDLVGSTPTGRIKFNYHSVQPNSLRKMITWADARWMTRQIAQLTKRQIAQAVAIGQWPRSAGRLLTEKLANRRNQLVLAFDLLGEPTPSGPIELLPVDRSLTTADGAVRDGELVSGEFEGSTYEFDNYWEELLGPVWDRFVIFVLAQIQRSVSAIPEIVFDERSVGLPEGLVVELLINFKRTTEENPNPASSREYYVTNDEFLLGARLGGGFVVRGEAAYYRKYSLITPAGTEGEAQYRENTVFNLLLPWQVHKADLPDEYVLVREDFLEGRGRAITDDISGGSAFGGAQVTLARVRLARDVISVRRGRVRAYHDVSVFDEVAFRAFIKAVFVRIPLANYGNRWGGRRGDFYELSEALERYPERSRAALSAFIRAGDTAALDAIADRIEFETDFRYDKQDIGVLDFVASEKGTEREDVELRDPLAEQPQPGAFRQIRVYRHNLWKFMDFKENYRWSAQTVAPIEATEPPPILMQFVDSDANTWSSELGPSYIGFINGVANVGRGKSKYRHEIRFTPSLHSVNDRWGHVISNVDIGFTPKAVASLLELDPEAFWQQLERELDYGGSRLRRYRGDLRATGKAGMTRARRVPYHDRRAIRHSIEMLELLGRARAAEDPKERYGLATEALAATAFRRGGGFDPRVLAALRELLGAREMTVDARISQPVWKEKRLPGGADLVLHTHKHRGPKLEHAPILFAPRGPVQSYEMLDSFDAVLKHGYVGPRVTPDERNAP